MGRAGANGANVVAKAGRVEGGGEDGPGLEIRDLVNHFLTAKQRRLDAQEMGLRSFSEYFKTSERIVKLWGAARAVEDLD